MIVVTITSGTYGYKDRNFEFDDIGFDDRGIFFFSKDDGEGKTHACDMIAEKGDSLIWRRIED